MTPRLVKFLLYLGIIEIIAGAVVFLLFSKMVGLIIILVGLSDLGFVYYESLRKGRTPPESGEGPPDEKRI